MIYDHFYFWYAKLLNWSKVTPHKRKKSYLSVKDESNALLPSIIKGASRILQVDSQPVQEKIVIDHGYFKWPRVNFDFKLSNREKPISLSWRIRINPCFQFEGKRNHHSKICAVIENNGYDGLTSSELAAVFNMCGEISTYIVEEAAKGFIKALGRKLEDSDPNYHLEASIASLSEQDGDREEIVDMFCKLQEDKILNRSKPLPAPAEELITDIDSWLKKTDSPIGTSGKPTWQILSSQEDQAVLLRNSLKSYSSMATVARIPSHEDRAAHLRNIIMPSLVDIIFTI